VYPLPSDLKESLKKHLFSPQTFQKSPSSSSIKRRSIEKKRERKKSSKSLSFDKGEFNILRGENIFKTFSCESIFSHSILPLQKPFSKPFENS
jgi:hypothetical protein